MLAAGGVDAVSNSNFFTEQRNGLLVAESHAAAEGGGGSNRAATQDAAVSAGPVAEPGEGEP